VGCDYFNPKNGYKRFFLLVKTLINFSFLLVFYLSPAFFSLPLIQHNTTQMSTTFTTALSTPTAAGVVITTKNTPTIRKRRTKLFFSTLYNYLAITFHFIYSFMVLPSGTTGNKLITNKKIPSNNSNAMQYYKNKTLILDLDETLVHSVRLGSEQSFNTIVSPSITSKKIEVQCDKQSLLYQVYKRPHVDFFLKTVSAYSYYIFYYIANIYFFLLKKISQWYKVVIYTASMAEYADPVIDWLDGENMISQRFFRQVRNKVF
jgi:hypothetical protein